MSLKVTIDHPNRPYYPGDVIKGRVDFSGDVETIHIMLLGMSMAVRTQTTGASAQNTTYRSRAPLLYQLHQLKIVLSSSNACWGITIPKTVSDLSSSFPCQSKLGRRYFKQSWPQSRNYHHTPVQPLPPTFGDGTAWQQSGCEISYSITAVGSVWGISSTGIQPHLFDSQRLWMQCAYIDEMTNDPVVPPLQSIVYGTGNIPWWRMTGPFPIEHFPWVSSMQIPSTSGRLKRRLSFSKKDEATLQSSSTSKNRLRITLDAPKEMLLGDNVQVTLTVQRESMADEGASLHSEGTGTSVYSEGSRLETPFASLPTAHIRNVGLQVKGLTRIWPSGSLSPSWGTRCLEVHEKAGDIILPVGRATKAQASGSLAQSKPPDSRSYSGAALTITPDATNSGVFVITSTTPVPIRAIPTFETFNIARVYWLRIRMKVTWAGVTEKIDVASPLVIRPRPMTMATTDGRPTPGSSVDDKHWGSCSRMESRRLKTIAAAAVKYEVSHIDKFSFRDSWRLNIH